jgi:hypothetical protein
VRVFHEWADFYIIVAPSAAALIGLMFVVVTLTADFKNPQVARGGIVYVTPIVFHFAIVLLIGAVSAVPAIPPFIVGAILAACAAFGMIYSVATVFRLHNLRHDAAWRLPSPDFSDLFFYGYFPLLTYGGLGSAAAFTWIDPRNGAYVIAAVLLVVLLIGIRNAWDLATTLAQVHRDEQRE